MTLTQTAILTKKVMLFSVIFLVVSISSWLSYRYYYYNIYLPSLPKVEEKPTVKFGILPFPPLSKTASSSANLTFSLDTPTGELPTKIPKLVKVYFLQQLGITLLDPDRARSLAKDLSFPTGPEVISPTKYKFKDSEGGELIIDLNTGNLNFKKVLATPSAQLQTLGNPEKLGGDFKEYLSRKGLLKDQLARGKTNAFYNSNLPVSSTQAEISLWQEDVDELPLITAEFDQGLIKTTISKETIEAKKYINLEYIYWPVDFDTLSTYPIKTVDQAYEDLQKGSGKVINKPPTNKISIDTIYLAYIIAAEYTPYLQPVYVFEGEDFTSLVPAIVDQYLEKAN